MVIPGIVLLLVTAGVCVLNSSTAWLTGLAGGVLVTAGFLETWLDGRLNRPTS